MHPLKYACLVLFIFLTGVSISYSQTTAIKTTEFEQLRSKTEDLLKIYPDSALVYAEQLITLAVNSKSDQLLANAYSTMANLKIAKALPDEAFALNEKSYTINEKLKNDTELSKNYSLYGTIYQHKADYVNAILNFNKALNLANDTKQYVTVSYCYRCLSKINLIQEKNEKALDYANKAINYQPNNSNPREKAMAFLAMADYYNTNNNFDSSNRYYEQAYKILDSNKIEISKAWVLSLWAILYAEKAPIKTTEMMLKAQSIFDTLSPYSVFSSNNVGNLGEMFKTLSKSDSLIKLIGTRNFPNTKSKLLEESATYLKRALSIAQNKKNALDIYYASGNLAELLSMKGDYKAAFEYLIMSDTYKDSIFSQKNKNAIAKLESEKEVLQLQATNKQRAALNKILIGAAAALLFIGFLGYRNFKNKQVIQKQKITELEKEKQLLTVDAMLKGQEEERSRLSKDLHDGLGGMLSGVKMSFSNMKENMIMDAANTAVFERSITQLDNTIAELRKVAHNLMPEALVKFGLKTAVTDFCQSMQLSSKIKIICEQLGSERHLGNSANVNVYRIIQELVNNSVKHAQANQVLVQLTTSDNKVLITVEDDGKGFNIEDIEKTAGIGYTNLKYRVAYLNGKIDINSKPNEGTAVNIELAV